MKRLGKTRLKSSSVPTFINLKIVGDQTNINVNTEVAYVLGTSNGLSVVANRVTLKAGITYVLFASLRHVGSLTNTAANYSWRDYTNNINLGVGMQVTSQDGSTKDGVGPSATVVIKPTTDIDVGVRCTAVSAVNQGLSPDATQASIHSVPEL